MTAILKALVVDDERLARRELISMLSSYESIQIVGEAEDVPSALQAIAQTEPDVIFLDIQMPGESGFDLVEKIPASIHIIFVTAYDDFAIRAFEVNALDYLLKPVNPERLRRAVDRLQEDTEPVAPDARKLTYEDRLFLLLNSNYRFLKIETIVSISGAGDYSEVTTTDGKKWLTSIILREWESRLPMQHFCRIHRSTIINLNLLERMEEGPSQTFRVFLKGIPEPYMMSRRIAAALKERFR